MALRVRRLTKGRRGTLGLVGVDALAIPKVFHEIYGRVLLYFSFFFSKIPQKPDVLLLLLLPGSGQMIHLCRLRRNRFDRM